MNLGAYRNKLVGELCTGTRRIVDLAMCVAHDPDVLLLDEPSSGIAQRETEALVEVINTIRHEVQCALVVIEHDIPLIRTVSDRLTALVLGAPIAVGDPADVLADPAVISAYLGTDDRVVERSAPARSRRQPLKAGQP
jgi:branched-chain amino acid transport system ATP-binding protein